LIVALPGLNDMRREYRIRQECEAMVSNQGSLAVERCISIVLNGRPTG
jgi:hypothetical protein